MEKKYNLKRYWYNIFSKKEKMQTRFIASARNIAVALLMIAAPALNAQVFVSYNFNSNIQGWQTEDYGTFTQSNVQPCDGGGSARANVFYDGTNNFISPLLGTATTALVNLSFDYKVVNYAALDAAQASRVSILGQWSNTSTGPWTTFFTINSLNHIASASCASKSASFTPTAGPLYVRFQNTAIGDESDIFYYYDNISFVQGPPPACLATSQAVIDAASITQNGFSFSWTASTSAPALGYEYEVRSSGTAGSGATGLAASGSVAAGITTATATGLSAATNYSVYVRAKCSATETSSWSNATNATTACGAVNIPYAIPFASTIVPNLPTCVTIQNIAEDFSFWKTVSGISGLQGNVMEYGYNYQMAADDWFYTPGLNLVAGTSYRLTFKYKATGYEEKLKVALGSAAAATSMTTTLLDIIIPASVETAQQQSIDFTVTTSGVFNLGFQAKSAANQNYLYVGEVAVGLVPSCLPPSNAVTNVTSITQTGFSFAWTASTSAPAQGYEYEIRTSGVAGSGAAGLATTGTVAAGIITATISGLSAGTSYVAYVRAKCSAAEASTWIATTSTTTLCSVVNIPYTVPLSSAVVPGLPNCVIMQNVNADPKFWKTFESTDGISGKVMQYSYSSTLAADDWFYTAALNLTAGTVYRVSFKYKITSFEEKLKVALGSSPTATSMTTTLLDLTIPSSTTGGQLQTIDFVVSTTGVYNVGFQAHSDANKNSLYVGEISVIVGPTCLAPTDLTITNLDKNTATISWTASTTVPANGYAYEVRSSGAAGSGATGLVVSGVTAAGIISADIETLTPNTEYFVYVSSNCASNDQSAWSAAKIFTTLCDYLVITAINDSTCVGSTAVLQVGGATTQVSWYATDVSLEVLESGPTFITPTLLETTSFWASASQISAGQLLQVGLGATVAESYQNPFYSLWSNNHTQHIILASELTQAGLYAGPLTSVALSVTNSGTLPMKDLTVKVGTTTATDMTNFVDNSGFTIVYTSPSLMPVNGLNTLQFSTPFIWDGTSNIVLEFCHGNTASSATMLRTVLADATSYPSSVKSHSSSSISGAAACGNTTSAKMSYNLRPVFTFAGSALCLAPSRTEVTATVNPIPVVTGDNVQTITVNALEEATLGNLQPFGPNVIWFPTQADAIAFTNPLPLETNLQSGATYFAVVTVDDCRSLPFGVLVSVVLGTPSQTMNSLSYYPNPVYDQVAINYSQNITSVTVYNLVGQKVLAINPNTNNVILDMSKLSAGTYMIQVQSDSASKVIKLIKK